jgi:hypothetical protein
MVPIGINAIAKEKITTPKSKGELGKGGRKIFNDTHPQYLPPQKRWRPKAVEENQTATKTENKTTTVQLFVGMADSPALKTGPTVQGAYCPTPEAEPSTLHQDTSNDVPTPMEEDDLQGEDLVDYGATPEHLEN